MREELNAGALLAEMDRRRAELGVGLFSAPVPAPLEAIRELDPGERSVYDASGSLATADAVRAAFPATTVDADARAAHDAAIVGTALARSAEPARVLERVRSALRPGGRALVIVPNRRSLFIIAGLAKNAPFTLPGAWPESGPGVVTLAEAERLLTFVGFVDVTVRARIGEAVPAGVAFPAQIAFGEVSLVARTPDDLRDYLTIAYVLSACRPR
jgi:hypothetical protein